MNKGKIVLTLLSAIVVAALLLAGCGRTTTPTTAPPTTVPPTTTRPAATTAPPTTVAPTTAPPTTAAPAKTSPTVAPTTPTVPANMAKVTLKNLDGSMMEKLVLKPKYGGTLTTVSAETLYFDNYFGPVSGTTYLTNENLHMYDWSKSLGGTGEIDYRFPYDPPPTDFGQGLAESWEIKDPETVIFHIRKGVRFYVNPASEPSKFVNGREMTADDVAFSIRKVWTAPKGHGTLSYPGQGVLDEIKPLDQNTVQMKWTPGNMPNSFTMVVTAAVAWPRDAIEKFELLDQWNENVGTGPYMLTDYVKANSASFVRNPDYWQKDPFFPENRLPYIENIKWLIVPDVSTQVAALRTGKIDLLAGLSLEDYTSLTRTSPDLKSLEVPTNPPVIYTRVDKPELPINNLKVRQALSMAIDRQAVKDQLYSGHAEIIDWPVKNLPQHKNIYIPITSLPPSIRELYEYKPDKAKQLLAEAGYTNGFKAKVVAKPTEVDWLNVVQFYWSKVGVDLTIDIKDVATFTGINSRKQQEDMITGLLGAMDYPFRLINVKPNHGSNVSMVNDPKVNQMIEDVNAAWTDRAKASQVLRDVIPYVLEQRYWVVLPAPNTFTVWWRWLPNFYGEVASSMRDYAFGSKYLWIDQDLKKSLGK